MAAILPFHSPYLLVYRETTKGYHDNDVLGCAANHTETTLYWDFRCETLGAAISAQGGYALGSVNTVHHCKTRTTRETHAIIQM